MTTHTYAPFEVKSADFQSRTFEGLASTWDLDSGGDVVHKGAYARTLNHFKSSGGKRIIPLIDNHGMSTPIQYGSIRQILGKMLDGEETDAGLHTQWQVVPGADGDELLHRIKGGFVPGLSIGYQVVGQPDYTEESRGGRKMRVRHLREIKLNEVSPVVFPMNEGALVNPASVKSLLEAARAGTLTADEWAELRALAAAAPAGTEDTPPAPAPEPDEDTLAPEAQAELKHRLLRLKLARIVTRAA